MHLDEPLSILIIFQIWNLLKSAQKFQNTNSFRFVKRIPNRSGCAKALCNPIKLITVWIVLYSNH